MADKIDTPKIHDKEIIRLDVDEVVKLLNESEEAEGLTENKIIILSGSISKKRYTKTFFNTLLENVDLDELNNDLEKKIDDKGNWFLR